MESNSASVFSIRQATRDDLDLLLAWRRAMFLDMGTADAAQLDAALPRFAEWLCAQWAREDRCRALLGEVDGTPVTCAIVWIYDWYPGARDTSTRRGYILNVYTLPAWRRHGFADRLVQAGVAWLRERGIRSVSLHASAQGQSVYARQGFRALPLHEMALRLDEDVPQ